jgi:hypothetical protein
MTPVFEKRPWSGPNFPCNFIDSYLSMVFLTREVRVRIEDDMFDHPFCSGPVTTPQVQASRAFAQLAGLKILWINRYLAILP